MTKQKAIAAISSACNWNGSGQHTSEELAEAKRIVCEATEKQIPKKPNLKITGTTGWNTEYRCPTCNGYVTKGYCFHCCQALDWSDTE